MDTIHLLILTPHGKYYDAEVTRVTFRNENFTLGITPHHSPLISDVDICELSIVANGKTITFATSGGLINVKKEEVTLILNSIESASEIDIERALSAKKRADERLANITKDVDVERAREALERAEARIDVYNKAHK